MNLVDGCIESGGAMNRIGQIHAAHAIGVWDVLAWGVLVWERGKALTAVAKPHAHQMIAPTHASSRFLRRMLRVFFVRTEPASSMPKPACMKKTSEPTNMK